MTQVEGLEARVNELKSENVRLKEELEQSQDDMTELQGEMEELPWHVRRETVKNIKQWIWWHNHGHMDAQTKITLEWVCDQMERGNL